MNTETPTWPKTGGQEINPNITVNVMKCMQEWAKKHGLKFR